MRHSTLVLALLAGLLVTSCGRKAPSPAASSNSAAVQNPSADDPLRSFKVVVSSCRVALSRIEPERVWLASDKWMKTVKSPAQLLFDVKHTESLVAPFSAFIDIKEQMSILSRDTEAEVRGANVNEPRPGDVMSYNRAVIAFAFVDEHWQVKGITQEVSSSALTTPTSGMMNSEELQREFPGSGPCLML